VSAAQAPVARLSVSPGSGTAPLTITASTSASTDPQGSALSSTINFGDGATAAGPTVSHTYTNAGNYSVTATVTNAFKLQSQATATVSATGQMALTIAQPVNNSTTYSPIHVVATGSAPSGVDALQIYLDGALVFQANAASFDTTIAATVGKHAVVVKVWDKLGNAYMQSVTVKVIAPLVTSLKLNSSTTAVGSSVQATLTATSGSFGSSFIRWGDGTMSSGPIATHTYSSPGAYTVTATCADALKAVSTTAKVTVQ